MNEGVTTQLYHFPSTNPQKVTFAFKELGLDCELVPVDLSKGEQRQPAFSRTTRSAECQFWSTTV